mmetsp:Transcript_97554/g.309410  ORF Transcript_97554/g.309410 Transcript_97554/m.309410 type:complete len:205 (+) Transcript_97554:271-885(+)
MASSWPSASCVGIAPAAGWFTKAVWSRWSRCSTWPSSAFLRTCMDCSSFGVESPALVTTPSTHIRLCRVLPVMPRGVTWLRPKEPAMSSFRGCRSCFTAFSLVSRRKLRRASSQGRRYLTGASSTRRSSEGSALRSSRSARGMRWRPFASSVSSRFSHSSRFACRNSLKKRTLPSYSSRSRRPPSAGAAAPASAPAAAAILPRS